MFAQFTNKISHKKYGVKFVLFLAFFLLILVSLIPKVWAVGLGGIKVRSNLGQAFSASANLLGAEGAALNASCVRARLVNLEGAFVSSVNIEIRGKNTQRELIFNSDKIINEPAVNLVVDINCDVSLHRQYSLLLDPPLNAFANSSPNMGAETESVVVKKNPAKNEEQGLSFLSLNQSSSQSQKSRKSVQAEESRKASKPQSLTFKSEPRDAKSVEVVSPSYQKSHSKSEKTATGKVGKDVLQLSDDLMASGGSSATDISGIAGLRMSDILSTSSGQALLQNTEELKAAQARMSAFLKEDNPNSLDVLSFTNASPNAEMTEIAALKKEAEQLKKQNQQDKLAFQSLKSSASHWSWVILLAVASLGVLGVLALVFYIRRNLGQHAQFSGASGYGTHVEQEMNTMGRVINHEQAEFEKSFNSKNTSDDFDLRNVLASSKAEVALADSSRSSTSSIKNAIDENSLTLEETNSSIFNYFAPRTNVKVEEISDVIQEAEFWASMNDHERAIEILQIQEQNDNPDSPVPWMYLLDLYRIVGNKEKYEALRARFCLFFNAAIPEFEYEPNEMDAVYLENYPHLIEGISRRWHTAEAIPFLKGLLVDDREGQRVGFALSVYKDILLLLGIANELERIASLEGPLPSKVETHKHEVSDKEEYAPLNFETIDFQNTSNKPG